MLGRVSCLCYRLLIYLPLHFFRKKTLRNTIRVSHGLDPDRDRRSVDVLSVLIEVQTVGKGYQQTTKIAASKEKLK